MAEMDIPSGAKASHRYDNRVPICSVQSFKICHQRMRAVGGRNGSAYSLQPLAFL